MSTIAVIVGVVLLGTLLAPFLVGRGGHLAPAAQINSPERLEALRQALLERYLEDEAAHRCGDLSKLAWTQRQTFLVNRYIDAVRRLDFVRGQEQAEAPSTLGKLKGGEA